MFHRERGPKTRAAASSVGGSTEWEVISYRETRFRTPVMGTAAAYAVRNAPVARPEERVAAVLDGIRGSTIDSGIVVPCVRTGASSVSPQSSCSLAAPADAVLADVMNIDAPVVAPGTHQERAAWLASKRAEPGVAVVTNTATSKA